MGSFQIKVVIWSVEIGGHHRNKTGTILAVICPAHLDTGNLVNCVGGICGLQSTGHEIFLFDGLGAVPRIDAGGTEKKKFFLC